MKKTIIVLILFLLSIVSVFAQESHDTEIEEGKELVTSIWQGGSTVMRICM